METKTAKGLKFVTHKPKDKLDPGFQILGWKLRWIAATQTEDRYGRPHRVLKKEDLPADILKDMERSNPDFFARDNTIRNRELVLAYCPIDVANNIRREMDQAARDQMARIKSLPSNSKGMKLDEVDVRKIGAGEEFFNN